MSEFKTMLKKNTSGDILRFIRKIQNSECQKTKL